MGVQQGRSPVSEVFNLNHYIVATSAATVAGCYGCEAYVATEWPMPWGRLHKVSRGDVNIAHTEPRLLCVTVCAARLAIDFLVAHCPTSASPLSADYDFILELKAVVRKCRSARARLFAAIDGSCRVGPVVSAAIGPEAADTEFKRGALSHSFPLGAGLFLPATFA